MTNTWRKNYRGERVRDGEWCRKCPSYNCNVCGTGIYKRRFRRRARHDRGWRDE